MYETPLEITFSCHLPSSSRSTAEIAHSSGFIVVERDLKILVFSLLLLHVIVIFEKTQ